MTATELALDHFQLEDTRVTRRYFGKFEKITGHLGRVAAQLEVEGRLDKAEVAAVARYLVGRWHTNPTFPGAGRMRAS